MNVMQIRRRRAYARNIAKSGGIAPISVSPINKRRQPAGGRSVRVRGHRSQRGWRIGAMSGTDMSAFALAAVVIGAYLLFHKKA